MNTDSSWGHVTTWGSLGGQEWECHYREGGHEYVAVYRGRISRRVPDDTSWAVEPAKPPPYVVRNVAFNMASSVPDQFETFAVEWESEPYAVYRVIPERRVLVSGREGDGDGR